MGAFPSFSSPYRNKETAKNILKAIRTISTSLNRKIRIMHVCGTHESTIAHWGIRELLPENIEVIAGPGCPVCVCPASDIDLATLIAQKRDIILTSFGDMLRVPSSHLSLAQARAQGADIRLVYSATDAIEVAKCNPKKEIVFFSVGFETTAPMTAAVLKNEPPRNFSVICSLRLIPPAMTLLLEHPDVMLDGFILPGHVSVIIGVKPYEQVVKKYQIPCAIPGFEPVDVLLGLYSILKQISEDTPKVDNVYPRAVKTEGNLRALKLLDEVFQQTTAYWRGIGEIEGSGLILQNKYSEWNAKNRFEIEEPSEKGMPPGCSCDKVLLGALTPQQCPLFNITCTPENPVGPCMVSEEGTCAIQAKYT